MHVSCRRVLALKKKKGKPPVQRRKETPQQTAGGKDKRGAAPASGEVNEVCCHLRIVLHFFVTFCCRSIDHGVRSPDSLKICRRGQSMFWSPKMLHSFIQNCPRKYVAAVRVCFDPPKMSHAFFIQNCCWITQQFYIIKDERLVSKMEGKTNVSRRLKQFDGLTWLKLTQGPLILRQIYATVSGDDLPWVLSLQNITLWTSIMGMLAYLKLGWLAHPKFCCECLTLRSARITTLCSTMSGLDYWPISWTLDIHARITDFNNSANLCFFSVLGSHQADYWKPEVTVQS